MVKWEYMYLDLKHTRTHEGKIAGEDARHIYQSEAILNELGNEGWEVVAAANPGMGQFNVMVILKRPKP